MEEPSNEGLYSAISSASGFARLLGFWFACRLQDLLDSKTLLASVLDLIRSISKLEEIDQSFLRAVRFAGTTGIAAARLWQKRHITSKESAALADKYPELVRTEKRDRRIFYFWIPLPAYAAPPLSQVTPSGTSELFELLSPGRSPAPFQSSEDHNPIPVEVPTPPQSPAVGVDVIDDPYPIDAGMCWKPASPHMSRARRNSRGGKGFDRERRPMPGVLS